LQDFCCRWARSGIERQYPSRQRNQGLRIYIVFTIPAESIPAFCLPLIFEMLVKISGSLDLEANQFCRMETAVWYGRDQDNVIREWDEQI